jgi:transposase InsO family protein
MNIHKNARLTAYSRAELARRVIVEGQTPKAVATAFGVCVKTVRKWVGRCRAEGAAGLADRSSRPHRLHRPTPQTTVAQIEHRRRQRYTGKQIAAELGVSPATVSRILKRLGLNRMSALEPAEPVRRYEREHPGELIHIDIKKLGRIDGIGHRITGDRRGQSNRRSRGEGLGWEYVHVCIDDASRLAFSKVLSDEKKESAVAFLKAAVAYYQSLGVKVERVMTDNGACYKSFAFRDACKRLGLKHIRTRPYTPKTNGKAERFIQTALREWAYAKAYTHSDGRTAELPVWLHRYNCHRPHGSLKDKTPISRLGQTKDNLLRLHT